MATKKLYWEAPYGIDFDARVVNAGITDNKFFVVLDGTMFHPEAGGQPADKGELRFFASEKTPNVKDFTVRVEHAKEDGDEVIHIFCLPKGVALTRPETLIGLKVKGNIDWPYRFDLMQQHTGQHLLSRVFEDVLGAKTVGFHLSDHYATIDLDIQSTSTKQVSEVEGKVNSVIFQNIPVTTQVYGQKNMPSGIRARFALNANEIRVVNIGQYDACPCGGTHVSSTGQIGLLKINQLDRAHGGIRVVFRCGGRALSDYGQKEMYLQEAAKLLSQSPDQVPEAVGALKEKAMQLEKSLTEAKKSLLDLEIHTFVAENAGASSVLVKVLSDKEAEELRFAAKTVSQKLALPVVFFTVSPRFQLVAACPKSYKNGAEYPNAREMVLDISKALGVRGGGTQELAQLGSKEPLDTPCDRLVEIIRQETLKKN